MDKKALEFKETISELTKLSEELSMKLENLKKFEDYYEELYEK